MKAINAWLAAVPLAAAAACAHYPAPQERLVASESAVRGAQEVGADTQPQAALHLKLAQEEIAAAQNEMRHGDNKRADFLLVRARADAELAIALARVASAQTEAQQAEAQARALRQSANP